MLLFQTLTATREIAMAMTPSPCHVLTRAPFTLRLMLVALFTSSARAEKPFQVITTFTVIQDMARQVAGEAAEGPFHHPPGRGGA